VFGNKSCIRICEHAQREREGTPPILKQERYVYSFHTSASQQLYRHGTVKEQRQKISMVVSAKYVKKHN